MLTGPNRDWSSKGHLDAWDAHRTVVRLVVDADRGTAYPSAAGTITARSIVDGFRNNDPSAWGPPLFEMARVAKRHWFNRGVSPDAINAYLDAFRDNFVVLMRGGAGSLASLNELRAWLTTQDSARSAVLAKTAERSGREAPSDDLTEQEWRLALATCDRWRRGWRRLVPSRARHMLA